MTRPAALLRLAVAPALLLVLVGCSPDSPAEPSAPATTARPSGTPTPTPTPTDAADTAALTALWDKYWVATTTAYAGPDPDPAIWAGIASDELIQHQVTLVQQYVTNGIRYSGSPTTLTVDADVDGDTAELTGCMDVASWVPESTTGEALPTRDKTVYPAQLTAHRLDGGWVLTATAENPSGVTC